MRSNQNISNPLTLDMLNVEAALDKAAEGATVREIADALGCSMRNYHRYLESSASFAQAIRQARTNGFNLYADETKTLIKDSPFADIDELRLEFDIRKWYLSKMHSSVFGDRLAVSIEHVDVSGALQDARSRVPKLINPPAELGYDPFADS